MSDRLTPRANVGGALVPRQNNWKAHSRNLRRNRLSELPETFFITKSLYPKRPLLNDEIREVIVSAFEFAIERERIYLRAFVVMPDHWHALFALKDPWRLPRFMHALMSFIGARTSSQFGSIAAWQDSYYDTYLHPHGETVRLCAQLH
jgi:REP element-mobilizing transposase RayT